MSFPSNCFNTILLLCILITLSAEGQEKPAYNIFLKGGKQTSYAKMLETLRKNEVILFGEIHNNSLGHWLELQVAKDLLRTNKELVLGMEMFEADNQLILDEYLNGLIEEKHLTSEAKVWENYSTDYKPVVDLFKENKARIIATNIPRRYASLVFKKGVHALDSLDPQVKQWMVPLPFEVDMQLTGYKSMTEGFGPHEEGGMNLVNSQAIKDATMAYFILKNLQGSMLHLNGSYHSQNDEGIVWYLRKSRPEIRIVTIQMVEQQDISKPEVENIRAGDFIICIPEDMTKTY